MPLSRDQSEVIKEHQVNFSLSTEIPSSKKNSVVVSSTTLSKLNAFKFQGPKPSGIEHRHLSHPQTSMDLMNANSGYGHTLYGGEPSHPTLSDVRQRLSVNQSNNIIVGNEYSLRANIAEDGIPFPSGQPPSRKKKPNFSVTESSRSTIVNNFKGLESSVVNSDAWTELDDFDDFDQIDDEALLCLEATMKSNTYDFSAETVQNQPAIDGKASCTDLARPSLDDHEGQPRTNSIFPAPQAINCDGLLPEDGMPSSATHAIEDLEANWFSMEDLDTLAAVEFEIGVADNNPEAREDWNSREMPLLHEQSAGTRRDVPSLSRTPEATDAEARVRKAGLISTKRFKFPLIRKPIVRPQFPKPVRDRSPVIALSTEIKLRTCFRIGEALNTGVSALQDKKNLTIELYARVASSHREEGGVKQHFIFADLFHNRPPFLNGVYELWKGSSLWEYDSGRFLATQGTARERLCRCIGRLKKDETQWVFALLNIWEASWDDVNHVKEIICS
jgi:hypothetical protein